MRIREGVALAGDLLALWLGLPLVVGGLITLLGYLAAFPWPLTLGLAVVGFGVAMTVVGSIRHQERVPAPAVEKVISPRPSGAMPPALVLPEKTPPDKEMTTLTPKRLTDLYKQGMTKLQSDGLVAQHIGRWRTVSTVVEQVEKHNKYVVSISGKDADGIIINLFFNPEVWSVPLSGLLPGDTVTALGQVSTVTAAQVIFEGCELLDNAPAGKAFQ